MSRYIRIVGVVAALWFFVTWGVITIASFIGYLSPDVHAMLPSHIPGKMFVVILVQLPIVIGLNLTAWRFLPPLILLTGYLVFAAIYFAHSPVGVGFAAFFLWPSAVNAAAIWMYRWLATDRP